MHLVLLVDELTHRTILSCSSNTFDDLQEVNSGVGGGEGASNMVSGYAHDPTALALEGRISKMESKMDEMHAMFAAFIKSATPNPPTIVVSPTKTVDARAIEVQDNQQVDQEAREKVCDAYPLFTPCLLGV
jgi:hypothetical protein